MAITFRLAALLLLVALAFCSSARPYAPDDDEQVLERRLPISSDCARRSRRVLPISQQRPTSPGAPSKRPASRATHVSSARRRPLSDLGGVYPSLHRLRCCCVPRSSSRRMILTARWSISID